VTEQGVVAWPSWQLAAAALVQFEGPPWPLEFVKLTPSTQDVQLASPAAA